MRRPEVSHANREQTLSLHVVTPERPPRHLAPTTKRVWRSIVETWELDPGALLVLQGALESWDTYQLAQGELRAAGTVTLTGGGNVTRAHPAAKVAADALKSVRLGFAQLKLDLPDGEAEQWARHARGPDFERKHGRKHG